MLSGPIAADAGGVVVGLFLGRDQLALLDDHGRSHVRAFIEELGRREQQHAVLLDDVQEAVLREADAVGDLHIRPTARRS